MQKFTDLTEEQQKYITRLQRLYPKLDQYRREDLEEHLREFQAFLTGPLNAIGHSDLEYEQAIIYALARMDEVS